MKQITAPLFPLTAHLLPAGKMALRIFEPRYVRMVKEACANETGFVMCMLNSQGDREKNEHIYSIGTYCKVIDFDLLEDGLLGIKVEGIHSVEISHITTEFDGLRLGKCTPVGQWTCTIDDGEIEPLRQKLAEVFERYPDISSMYTTPKFDDSIWVVYRWLELLPVDAEQKQSFLQQKDCQKLLNYINDLVK